MSEHRTNMLQSAQEVFDKCKACKLCQKECPFLKKHGQPKDIAKALLEGILDPEMAYGCTLCGFCNRMCPIKGGLDIRAMFQAMRDCAASENPTSLKPFEPLIRHEKTGLTDSYSYFGIPKGADKIFFPGCALSGIRPDAVWNALERLKAHDSNMGLVLHCCSRISAMLGRRELHEKNMTELVQRLEKAGVREIITACPSCMQTFQDAGVPFDVNTVYEVLAPITEETTPPDPRPKVTVQDACTARYSPDVAKSARKLMWASGYSVTDTRHTHFRTICCGEGGGVRFHDQEISNAWTDIRLAEAGGMDLAVYCATGLDRFHGKTRVMHVLDMLEYGPDKKIPEPAKPPKTYENRLALRKRAMEIFGGER